MKKLYAIGGLIYFSGAYIAPETWWTGQILINYENYRVLFGNNNAIWVDTFVALCAVVGLFVIVSSFIIMGFMELYKYINESFTKYRKSPTAKTQQSHTKVEKKQDSAGKNGTNNEEE